VPSPLTRGCTVQLKYGDMLLDVHVLELGPDLSALRPLPWRFGGGYPRLYEFALGRDVLAREQTDVVLNGMSGRGRARGEQSRVRGRGANHGGK
jgi:hypothetical protein